MLKPVSPRLIVAVLTLAGAMLACERAEIPITPEQPAIVQPLVVVIVPTQTPQATATLAPQDTATLPPQDTATFAPPTDTPFVFPTAIPDTLTPGPAPTETPTQVEPPTPAETPTTGASPTSVVALPSETPSNTPIPTNTLPPTATQPATNTPPPAATQPSTATSAPAATQPPATLPPPSGGGGGAPQPIPGNAQLVQTFNATNEGGTVVGRPIDMADNRKDTWAGLRNGPAAWIFDLGTAQKVGGLKVWPQAVLGEPTQLLSVQVSNDGATWVTVISGSGDCSGTPNCDALMQGQFIDLGFAATTARYLRLNGGPARFAFAEVQVALVP